MILKRLIKFAKHPMSVKLDLIFFKIFRKFKWHGYLIANRYVVADIPISIDRYDAYPHIKNLYKSFVKFNNDVNNGDWHRLVSFVLNIEKALDDGVSGDLAELGVWKGNTAAVLAYYAKRYQRKLYLFDTFSGFDQRDLNGEKSKFDFSDTSADIVNDVIGREYQNICIMCKGYFPESIPDKLHSENFSVVSLDADLYAPMKAGLDWFFPRMSRGALFLLHDYSSKQWDECKKAIDEFCIREGQSVVLMPDKYGSAFIRIHK